MVRPTPESLRLAADKTEEAEKARKAALDAVEAANLENAKAATADTNADAALLKAGVNVANGGSKKTTTKATSNGNNGGNGGDRRNFFTGGGHLGWFPLAVLLLVLATVIALAWFKADKSQVDRLDVKVENVDAKANDAKILGEKNKTRISALKKDVEQAASIANMANDKADKALNKPCSVCVKEEVILPSKPKSKPAPKPVHKPRQNKPVTPAPATVGKVTPECTDCKPTPEFIPRKQVASAEGFCGIVVEDAKTKNVIANFLLQPYSGEKDMSRKGNLQIMQVAEFKMGEIHRIEGAITGVKHTDCLQAIKYVESQWPKVVKNFKLPDDCLPVRYGS